MPSGYRLGDANYAVVKKTVGLANLNVTSVAGSTSMPAPWHLLLASTSTTTIFCPVAASISKYYDYAGTLQTEDLSKIEYIMYDWRGLHIVDLLSMARPQSLPPHPMPYIQMYM